MTGRYPFRYGLQTIVIPSKGTYGLATDEYTLPQTLKDAGYRTEMIGKWHLGHADKKYWPRQRGFDYHYGAVLGEIDYFTHSAHDVLDWQRDNKTVEEEGYVTQLLGADAVKRIEGHDPAKPLFMYLAFTAAHTPYQATPEYLEKYKHIADETRRAYAGQITCMDQASYFNRVCKTLFWRIEFITRGITYNTPAGRNLTTNHPNGACSLAWGEQGTCVYSLFVHG